MDAFLFSANAVVPVFILMLIGQLLKRFHIIDDTFIGRATKLIFGLAIPCMLFVSIAESDFYQIFDLKLILFVVGGMLLAVVLLSLLVPLFIKDPASSAAFIHSAFRSNIIILGMAIIKPLAGDEGTAMLSLVLAFVTPVQNFLAVLIMSRAEENISRRQVWRNIYTNPLIIATLLGLIISLLHVRLPSLIHSPLQSIAEMTVPFSLLVMGGNLELHKGDIDILRAVCAAVVKTFALALIALVVGYFFKMNALEMSIILVIFGSPTAISTFAMTYQMNGNHKLASMVVVFSHILSLLTLFMFIFILRLVNII